MEKSKLGYFQESIVIGSLDFMNLFCCLFLVAGLCHCSRYVFLLVLDCLVFTNMEEIQSDQAKMHSTKLMIAALTQIGAWWLLNFDIQLNLSCSEVRLR